MCQQAGEYEKILMQSKHLKGHLGSPVSDVTFFHQRGILESRASDVTFFHHRGQLGSRVSDVTFFSIIEVTFRVFWIKGGQLAPP